MKSILIVNDDGIDSPGIRAAAEAVRHLGDVTVVAPSTQQSGVGRSLSLRRPLAVKKAGLEGFNAYSVDGTPVDSVIVGIFGLMRKTPDLLISGINLGENMSREITTSGTVCAAIEGANHGIPSVAISLHLDSEARLDPGRKADLRFSKKTLASVSKAILERGLPEGVDLLNINIPDSDAEGGIKITTLAHRMYSARVHRLDAPSGGSSYYIDGDAIFDAEPGTDVYAVRVERCVSITPLTLDLTARSDMEDIGQRLLQHLF
ncbi:MAG: 5'/3'-nucleotidase SurE [Methanobacteriota archaeon]|nr:MAG: 5'/3'-nucleotidase SurE [Euryarchaeota archaeon]